MANSPYEFFDSISNAATSVVKGTNIAPSVSGVATRQQQVFPQRDAISKRQAMRWVIPEQPIVEMYINPQSVNYQYKKLTIKTRVKGGFSLQYWGEDLIGINASGTTGSSGIEGINVLLDVYRNEQLMFDPYALMLQAQRDKENQKDFNSLLFSGITGNDDSNIVNARNKPTLASLAFTVEMYWMGEVFRGFFESFDYKESVDRLGLFDYNFTFTATQRRGFRTNFMPWHHHPSYGQSNWGGGGPPLSFASLVKEEPSGNPIVGSNKAKLNEAAAELASYIDAYYV
jgi:hypothetical protein